jgi:ADP-L-glycero-D-manno-heptose 6-epimerase
MSPRTYLITGGAGFIGSNIAAGLAARGDEVIVCDWLGRDERWRNLAKHRIADVILPDSLDAWLARHGGELDAIIHMGAISATTETDVDVIVRNNVRLTLDLWQWCTVNRKSLIFASSAATYGDGGAGFVDDQDAASLDRLLPLNAYGWSKHFVDRRVSQSLAAGAPSPPQWVGLKFFNVYGPNEYHKGAMKSVVAHNAPRAAAGEAIKLFRSYWADYPDGGQKRDFVYVRDCVDVILWFLENHDRSGLFNLGTGHARSWSDLAKAVFTALNRAPRIEFIDMPEQLKRKYQYFTQADMKKLRDAGYNAPFTSLEDGVADYVRNYLLRDDPYR